MSSDQVTPRILVEGGPFWRQVRYTLWFLLGCIIGVVIAFVIAFHTIQNSRTAQCEATNKRNRVTIQTLETQLAEAHVSEVQRKQTLRFTISLIDDLVPYKNCHKTVT